MSKAIGIDLGTTNSCASVIINGQPVILPNEKGERTTPSVVAFTKEGERLVGASALRQCSINSERTVRSVKREMGSSWSINVEGKRFSAPEISAMILRRLKQDAENYLGEPVQDAVITVPAYFDDVQRQATKDAGRIAGFHVLRIINEPTSAALAYGLNNGAPQKIMVYDLGGGTFDVSIIEIGSGVIEVLATNGDNHLGGDDFDAKITDFLLSEIKKLHGVDLKKDMSAFQRIREAAEQAKKDLSVSREAVIRLPYLSQKGKDILHFEYKLTRSLFDDLTRELVNRTAVPVQNALRDAGITPADLSKVLLVGGSTRIPAIQEKVRFLTGIIPSKSINPDECVAQGAAIQADILSTGGITLSGADRGNGILLLDVTPLSLSIETVGGVATRLIERNSTLPIHYSQIFSTAMPFQRSVEINVLQGERPMARDNKSIGKFRLNGIQMAPAGVPQIEVSFDIDTNGILQVSAKDLSTGKSQSISITTNGKMSDNDIDAAIRDAEQYASQDSLRRDAVQLNREANDLLLKAENCIRASRKDVPKEKQKKVKSDIASLRKLLPRMRPDRITDADLQSFRSAIDQLNASCADAFSFESRDGMESSGE